MRIFPSLAKKIAQAMANPRVFFDITADGQPLGRIIMELNADVVPRTAGTIYNFNSP